MKKLHKAWPAIASIFTIILFSGWQYSAQPYFEGEIIFNMGMDGSMIAGDEKDMPEKITLLYKGSRMKMTPTGGKNKRETIYDISNNTEYSIDHARKKVYKKSQADDDEAFGKLFKEMELTLEAKPDTPTIAGYKCQRHVITAEMPMMAMTIDLFTSNEIKVREGAGGNPLMDKMGLQTEEIKGFPLGVKFSFHFQGKSESMMMEAEEVISKKLSSELFELPKDYEVIER